MNSLSSSCHRTPADDIDSLKPLSASAIRLANECQQPEPDVEAVVDLIEHDPVLASKILSVANSPLYGYTRQIASVQRALIVLGLRTISNLAVSFSAMEMFSGTGTADNARKKLLHHSLGCAVICRLLTVESRTVDANNAFLSGILHDIGKLALLNREPESYLEFLQPRNDVARLDREIVKFGDHHAAVGSRYIQKMRLPADFADAVADHHNPEATLRQLGGVVSIANSLSKIWLEGRRDVLFDPTPYAEFEPAAIQCFEAVQCSFQDI